MNKMLRDKKGMTLIFVLAVTMMLMTLSLSIFTAAAMSVGMAAANRERIQLELLLSSAERITARLMEENGDVDPDPDGDPGTDDGNSRRLDEIDTLTGYVMGLILAKALQANNDPTGLFNLPPPASPIDLSDVHLDGSAIINIGNDIDSSFGGGSSDPEYINNAEIRVICNDIRIVIDTANPGVEFTARISGTFTLRITVYIFKGITGSQKTLVAEATYIIIDEPAVLIYSVAAGGNPSNCYIRDVLLIEMPERRLVSNERITA